MPRRLRIGYPREVRISGDGASYSVSGQSAGTYYGRNLISNQGSYSLSGQSNNLIYTPSGGGGGSQTFDEGTDPGTQWFVRPNGTSYGTGSGTSWTNAWSGFSAINWTSVAAGDTIWVAGGSYTQALSPNKAGTSTNTIKIRRARSDSAQCIGGAGWSSAFDSDINHTSSIGFTSTPSWIIISGAKVQTGGNVPCDDGSCGWKITASGGAWGNAVNWYGSGSNNTVRWLDLQGAGQINYSADSRAIDMTPSVTCSNNTISHCWIRGWESGVYCVTASAPIFEYIVMEDIAPLNTTFLHPNGIITWGCPNGIVRYSIFRKGPNGLACGEGVFFEQAGGSGGWQIYGNVFRDIDYVGVKAIEITSAVGAIKIYNNTFVNVSTGTIYTSDSPSATGGEQINNYVYNCGVNTSVSGMSSSNNITATNTAQFVNYSSRNLHLVSTANGRNAGTALTSNGFYNKDMDGNTRGSDGAWDVGAYEFV